MKKLFTNTTFAILAICLAFSARAQMAIGTIYPDASAQLEIASTTRGFLPPRMTTAQRDAIVNPAYGVTIYNSTTNCLETFTGVGSAGAGNTGWKNLCRANINATFTSGTLSCSGTLNGNFVATVPMDTTNYKIVTVTTLSAGDYSVSSDVQNGVQFSAAGTIASVGAGTQLKLTASGMPLNTGAFTYTVTLSGQTCTFTVTYAAPPATLQNGAVTCAGALAGNYTAGGPMTGSNTKIVSVTPTSVGYCNLQTDVQNGVSFSVSTTFNSGQVNNVQNLTLVASGTPITQGTFTYTIGGTNVTSPCTFTVTYACPTITTGFSSTPTTAAGVSARFTLSAPCAGKFILAGSANVWTSNSGNWVYYTVNANGTTIANSALRPFVPANVNQNIPANGEFTVSTAGTYNVDFILGTGDGFSSAKLEWIFIPSPCSGTFPTAGILGDGASLVNNSPSAGSHRFTLTATAAGRYILLSKLSIWTSNSANAMAYDLKNSTTVLGTGRISGAVYANTSQELSANGYLDVAAAGSYNIDLVPQSGSGVGYNGTTDPHLYWIFIPSGSAITSGSSSSTAVNNTPATGSHRFTVTVPAAGKLILIGNADMWQGNLATFGYDIKNNSTTLEQVRLNNQSPANVWQQLPFATELATTAAGTVNIDVVPTAGYGGIERPNLIWLFIP